MCKKLRRAVALESDLCYSVCVSSMLWVVILSFSWQGLLKLFVCFPGRLSDWFVCFKCVSQWKNEKMGKNVCFWIESSADCRQSRAADVIENGPRYKLVHLANINKIVPFASSTPDWLPVESKTLTYNGRVGSGRRSARQTAGRGEAWQNSVPTIRSAPKPTVPVVIHGNIKNCFERLLTSTNKENPS